MLPGRFGQGITNDIKTFSVPTINPYYPTNAPNNLQVSYDFAHEYPPNNPAYEISYRYQFGSESRPAVRLDRPDLLFPQLRQRTNTCSMRQRQRGQCGVGQYCRRRSHKPASIPYLNLFCDPDAFQCNSPATLDYISGKRYVGDDRTDLGTRRALRRPAVRSSRRAGQGGRRRHL